MTEAVYDIERLLRRLDRDIASFQQELNKFSENFKKEPAHALNWAMNSFEAAASLELYTKVKAGFDNQNFTIETMLDYLTEEVIILSSHIENSSNPMSVVMERHQLAAKAKMVRLIKDYKN